MKTSTLTPTITTGTDSSQVNFDYTTKNEDGSVFSQATISANSEEGITLSWTKNSEDKIQNGTTAILMRGDRIIFSIGDPVTNSIEFTAETIAKLNEVISVLK